MAGSPRGGPRPLSRAKFFDFLRFFLFLGSQLTISFQDNQYQAERLKYLHRNTPQCGISPHQQLMRAFKEQQFSMFLYKRPVSAPIIRPNTIQANAPSGNLQALMLAIICCVHAQELSVLADFLVSVLLPSAIFSIHVCALFSLCSLLRLQNVNIGKKAAITTFLTAGTSN